MISCCCLILVTAVPIGELSIREIGLLLLKKRDVNEQDFLAPAEEEKTPAPGILPLVVDKENELFSLAMGEEEELIKQRLFFDELKIMCFSLEVELLSVSFIVGV